VDIDAKGGDKPAKIEWPGRFDGAGERTTRRIECSKPLRVGGKNCGTTGLEEQDMEHRTL
jgi:hypothetical protein